MIYDKENGRADVNGAPVGREHGMGSLDVVSDASPSRSKAPSFDFRPDQLDAFRGTHYDLIPLHAPNALDQQGRSIGKAPRKGWRSSDALTVDDAIEHMASGGNVGVRLGSTDLVVDIDPRNFAPDDDPVARLQVDLGIRLSAYPEVVTGSGGRHFYMKLPAGSSVRETVAGYDGIEFKTVGRQMVAPGSVHPDTRGAYLWDDLTEPLSGVAGAPDALLELISRPVAETATEPGELTPDQLAVMLQALDPVDYRDHDRWFELMCACHHATAGDGREEFVGWSVSDPNYADQVSVIEKRWDSLQAASGRRSITARTLYKRIADAGRSDVIPRDAAEDDFPDDLGEAGRYADATKRRGVIDDWVYVIDAEQFVRRADGKKWKKDQWKTRYASLKPDGDVLNAVWKGNLPLRKFEALVYVPGQPEFPDGESGSRYNIWRESGVRAVPGDVQIFLDHMEYLFPDEIERGYVLDYLAMLVQSPGDKVNYALLVKGSQGTGKSWLGRLMTEIIGTRNVVQPSNGEVMSNWTVWTEGAQLAIIEELMCVGRLDMANRLKPIITEPMLRIEAKGCSLYSIPNHLNLIAFTNHDDAVPIERGDRRWLIVFSEAKPRDDEYYVRLFDFLQGDGPAAVKAWLLDRKVTLNPKGVAPRTKGKDEMRRLSLGEGEQSLAVMLDEAVPPFDFDLVRVEEILDNLPTLFRRQKGFRNRVVKWLAEDVGAVKHSRYTKGDDDRPAYWLWSVRNHEQWADAGAAARIDAYLAHRKEVEARW